MRHVFRGYSASATSRASPVSSHAAVSRLPVVNLPRRRRLVAAGKTSIIVAVKRRPFCCISAPVEAPAGYHSQLMGRTPQRLRTTIAKHTYLDVFRRALRGARQAGALILGRLRTFMHWVGAGLGLIVHRAAGIWRGRPERLRNRWLFHVRLWGVSYHGRSP